MRPARQPIPKTTPSGVVFNIQRFSLHDGPGIRTTVFLKGCTLRCFWCHNPEGQHATPEVRYYPDRCIACGQCVTACPQHAHALVDGVHTFDRARCDFAAACVTVCNARALETEGRRMSVPEVMAEILPDRPFYELSGGGVTLSGGEPALNHGFAREVLRTCKDQGLHTAVETCGAVPWTALRALVPHTDLFMMDLKVIDPAKHHAATLSLNGLARRIVCPLYIVSGKLDRVIPWQHAERLAREAGGEVVFNLIKDGNHIANNRPYRWRAQSADWLAGKFHATVASM